MSLRVPLTVRLQTARGSRTITGEARDLWFRSVVPGGFASATVSLTRPLTIRPDEIDYYGRMYVYDARTGETVCEGRLEDPGRSAGRDGQVWSLTAIGPSAHTRDRTVPLAYVDSALRGWERIDNITPGGTDEVVGDPNGGSETPQVMSLRLPKGTDVITDSRVVMRNSLFSRTGQKIALVSYGWDAGLTTTVLYSEAIVSTTGVGLGDVVASNQFNMSGGTVTRVVGTNWSLANNRDRVDVRIRYTSGPGTVSQETWWGSFYNMSVRALLLDPSGSEITTGYSLPTVYAHEVVADLLGRLLPQYDGPTATIATTTHPIDQLTYPDGVTAERILADLMAVESGYYWAAWESNTAGRHRFEWVPWPTTVRYEADVTDGYDSTGSADGLYNAVRVRYRTPDGAIVTVRRTGPVPALDAAGLTREALIDLGDEVGSVANAQRAGDEYLLQHATPPNSGRLTVARPILDRMTGRMVMPWEIRPGQLIRVRGILPRPDALNATSRDGVTVFRVVSVEFRASDAAAVLELDSPAPTLPKLVGLNPANNNKRRR